ncbi:hypothetical protein [Duganella sp.]|uniref:hypothetical protein n=1 Tax=Duganella sp. TaxID=1904440 RepID=UPI0031D8C09D
MFNFTHRAAARVLAALLLLVLAHVAHALPLLTLTPNQSIVSASAGDSIHIAGSIINRTNAALDATELFLNFANFDPTVLTPLQELGQVPFSLPSFSFRDHVALFTVDVAAGAAPGPQPLDVTLQDVNGNYAYLITILFRIDEVVAVPEPATLSIMLAGLMPLLRRRHPHGGHHG